MPRLAQIVAALISPRPGSGALPLVDVAGQFEPDRATHPARSLNAAFLIAAAAGHHPGADDAAEYLDRMADSGEWQPVASFYRDGLRLMSEELEAITEQAPDLAARLDELASFLARDDAGRSADDLAERLWSVFFPEGTAIRGHEHDRADELRRRRTIEIVATNPDPITDPGRRVLFTANALLTVPPEGIDIDTLDLDEQVKLGLRSTMKEAPLYWYDHPVQIGVELGGNELLYGLRGVEQGVAFEKARGTMSVDQKLVFVLSVSVTHQGLGEIARRYILDQVRKMGGLEHVDLYAFTEADTAALVADVLVPAAESFLGRPGAHQLLDVFGVHGRYGRHHSFLKAIAAVWQVVVDPEVVATFKTDLDQTWPQETLVTETGRSLLEQFRFRLWGGTGIDGEGHALELGAMAGRLVNESDIEHGLFTPDVSFPDRPLDPDEFLFFSPLPQALSTVGEVASRYRPAGPDGTRTALERVHVHGGTAGILIDSLRRHRPFTPSFIGRAEDQAYVLSLYGEPEPRLAYVHHDSLIQRHDKKGFAGEAIEAARIPTMIGDYVRILLFSSLADALTKDRGGLKAMADPFTGCFISEVPVTVVYLRFALKAAAMFAGGEDAEAVQFVTSGAARLAPTLAFVAGGPSELEVRYRAEREGWDLFYETLSALEDRLQKGDAFATELARRARRIVSGCRVD